jgi:hypothetical protein
MAAAQAWENTQMADAYIQQAIAQPGIELAVLISAYRYYFYKNNNEQALAVAIQVCDRIQATEQWPTDWKRLKPILGAHLDNPMARLFLNAYAAVGLLRARLGEVEVARQIATQVQELEAKEFGAESLLNILNPSPEEDD